MDPSNESDDVLPPEIEEAFAAVDAINARPTKEQLKAEKEKEKMQPKMAKEIKKMMDEGEKPAGEDVAKHQEMIITLTRWGSHPRFEQYLKDQGFTLTVGALKKKSLGDLQELEQRVKICIGARGQSKFISNLALAGVVGLETIGTMSPGLRARFDISGVSDALKQNEAFLDAIAELEMEYSSISSFGPKTRILLTLCEAMNQANNVNQARKFIQYQAAVAMEALNNPQAAAPRQPIIPNQSGAHVEDDDEKEVADRPMPTAATPA